MDDKTNTTVMSGGRLPSPANGMVLNGGVLNILGTNTGGSNESVGSVYVLGGNSTIMVTSGTGGAASPVIFTIDAIAQRVTGATINFEAGAGQVLGGSGAADEIVVPGAVLTGNILPYATVTDSTGNVTVTTTPTATTVNSGGFNLATLNGSNVVALTTYQPLSATSGNSPTDNVLVSATTPTPIASDVINSLFIVGSGINVKGVAGLAPPHRP